MKIDEMSDDQVLAEARGYGPSIIGQELFDRAQRIARVNPGGVLGPAIIGTDNAPAVKPPKAKKNG
ncbi:MAG: hypothetical protein JWO56_3643 [Acidobacteria bacterium]|nr:hypothetical protein [Acidobacteriota bacterium]